MQENTWHKAAFMITLVCGIGLFMVASGGDLDPPAGPVAPTMKTLNEVEPRIAINDVNTPGSGQFQYTIFDPGSYFLTKSETTDLLKGGIEVLASNVTIDLNGYTLAFGGGAIGVARGVDAEGMDDVTIRNGTLDGFLLGGIAAGDRAVIEDVRCVNNSSHGIVVEEQCVLTNCIAIGNADHGIFTGRAGVVTGCVARDNGDDGIHVGPASNVRGSVSRQNGANGFVGQVASLFEKCQATLNAEDGFDAGPDVALEGCTADRNVDIGIVYFGSSGRVVSCTANHNGSDGIRVISKTLISDCVATDNDGAGIAGANDCDIRACTASSNAIIGIFFSDRCSITDCLVTINTGAGIRVQSTCEVRGNTCTSNGFSTGNGAGILVIGIATTVDGNNVMNNDRGIEITGDRNLVVRNTAANHVGGDYVLSLTLNDVGTIQTSPTGAGAWDNFSF